MLDVLFKQEPKFRQDQPCVLVVRSSSEDTQMSNFVFQAAGGHVTSLLLESCTGTLYSEKCTLSHTLRSWHSGELRAKAAALQRIDDGSLSCGPRRTVAMTGNHVSGPFSFTL